MSSRYNNIPNNSASDALTLSYEEVQLILNTHPYYSTAFPHQSRAITMLLRFVKIEFTVQCESCRRNCFADNLGFETAHNVMSADCGCSSTHRCSVTCIGDCNICGLIIIGGLAQMTSRAVGMT